MEQRQVNHVEGGAAWTRKITVAGPDDTDLPRCVDRAAAALIGPVRKVPGSTV
jgi:hypothetical protein